MKIKSCMGKFSRHSSLCSSAPAGRRRFPHEGAALASSASVDGNDFLAGGAVGFSRAPRQDTDLRLSTFRTADRDEESDHKRRACN